MHTLVRARLTARRARPCATRLSPWSWGRRSRAAAPQARSSRARGRWCSVREGVVAGGVGDGAGGLRGRRRRRGATATRSRVDELLDPEPWLEPEPVVGPQPETGPQNTLSGRYCRRRPRGCGVDRRAGLRWRRRRPWPGRWRPPRLGWMPSPAHPVRVRRRPARSTAGPRRSCARRRRASSAAFSSSLACRRSARAARRRPTPRSAARPRASRIARRLGRRARPPVRVVGARAHDHHRRDVEPRRRSRRAVPAVERPTSAS